MEFIQHAGQDLALGCLDRTAAVGSLRACLEEAIVVMPQASWEPCDFSDLAPTPGLQGNHGACVAFQCVDAVETARKIAGLGDVGLSPWHLYAQICGGRDQGANIGDALTALEKTGVCRLADCPAYTLDEDCATYWQTIAKRYKVEEAFDCPNRASIATAIQCRFPTPLGLSVYGNFTELETIGGKPCIPRPAGRLRGGHCVLGCGLDYIGGVWRVKVATKSWGLGFGDQGCAWYTLDWLSDTYADAWAVRSVTYTEQ
jgi:hypothetical protein